MRTRSHAEELMDQWMQEAGLPVHDSIAPTLFDFARGDSSGEIACAYAYVALSGFPVPLDRLMNGDSKRRAWVIRAMMEHATGEWEGTRENLEVVFRRHPLIGRQAKAARLAWNV